MAGTGNDYPRWIAGFLGVPWLSGGTSLEGADCWGLLTLAQHYRGIEMPDDSPRHYALLREFLTREVRWDEVAPERAEFGDVAVFRYEMHVGFVLAPGVMLHVDQGLTSEITRFDGPAWGNRLVGIWRYRG